MSAPAAESTSIDPRRISGIVIGASAGGVDALSVLLPALQRQATVPVFVVLHLPRDRPSLLADIFASKCALPCREAQDKEPVVPGTIYFAPPDYHLLLDRGPGAWPHLALSADALVNFSRPAIDVLFESAADIYGECLLGIVLTGGNHDGAAGLKAIHEAQGQTIVQDPADAQLSFMPEAALATVTPSAVMSLAQIARLLSGL
ncbi:chemotaxis protein CheB [Aquabacterium soli]|uniref:protein-glutamate methylesterase n=1 Tax=Aquabacterium soli TaxID=2493092 RepID=A0A3R8S5C4_9BURK|nr:chemotaxis protein CheB [Aquabacterium soli]RRS05859.1 chemotaxis protein CheB [Aquabacterium soli]